MIKEILKQNRSYRRFFENKEIGKEILFELVENLRFCSSARNQQVLVYKIVTDKDLRAKVYKNLKWAGYLKDWNGPIKGARPTAYVMIGLNKDRLKFIDKWVYVDLGIVAQSLSMQAVEKELGCCNIGAFNRTEIDHILQIPNNIELQLVVALGYPKDNVQVEDIEEGESIEYRREDDIHIVPKRKIDDILF